MLLSTEYLVFFLSFRILSWKCWSSMKILVIVFITNQVSEKKPTQENSKIRRNLKFFTPSIAICDNYAQEIKLQIHWVSRRAFKILLRPKENNYDLDQLWNYGEFFFVASDDGPNIQKLL